MRRKTCLRSGLDHTFCDLRLATNADSMVGADDGDEFVLRHGFLVMIDMEALRFESGYCFQADVL